MLTVRDKRYVPLYIIVEVYYLGVYYHGGKLDIAALTDSRD